MTLFQSYKTEVKESTIHGRGVFATVDIFPDEIIEECHFVVLDQPTKDSNLYKIVFSWPMGNPNCHAVVLGTGSIFNHSENNNATWYTDEVNMVFRFVATKFISCGQEILTNYMT